MNKNGKRTLNIKLQDKSKKIRHEAVSKPKIENTVPLEWTEQIYRDSLLEEEKWRLKNQNIIINDKETGFMVYFPNALSEQEIERLKSNLDSYNGWHAEFIKMMGKTIETPRKVCSFGEQNQTYTYSGITEKVKDGWNGLEWLLEIIKSITNQMCNYAHANEYRDGSQYIGFHSDNEGDMVENSMIISISIGQERDFQIRKKTKKADTPSKITTVRLKSGSIVIMGGNMQKNWKHALPKRAKQNGKRYNLTFRKMKN